MQKMIFDRSPVFGQKVQRMIMNDCMCVYPIPGFFCVYPNPGFVCCALSFVHVVRMKVQTMVAL